MQLSATRLAICVLILAPLVSARAEDSVASLLSAYSGHQTYTMAPLQPGDLETLRSGEVIIRVSQGRGVDKDSYDSAFGIHAMVIVEAPKLLVWLAIVRDSEELDGRFTRAVLSQGPAGTYVRYQHIDLPWPVDDRHWVIRVENNLRIADLSDGRVWERSWRLHDQGRSLAHSALDDGTIVGLTRDALDESIYLPVNSGSWTLFSISGTETLVAAFVDADIGGRIPDGLIQRFARRQLRSGLLSLDELVEKKLAAIDESADLRDGHGMPVAMQEVDEMRKGWLAKRQASAK